MKDVLEEYLRAKESLDRASRDVVTAQQRYQRALDKLNDIDRTKLPMLFIRGKEHILVTSNPGGTVAMQGISICK